MYTRRKFFCQFIVAVSCVSIPHFVKNSVFAQSSLPQEYESISPTVDFGAKATRGTILRPTVINPTIISPTIRTGSIISKPGMVVTKTSVTSEFTSRMNSKAVRLSPTH